LPEAANALRQAIRLQPDFAGAHTTLAAVLRQLGDINGAAAESKAGSELSKEKNNQQTALFATNSGKRLLTAGTWRAPSLSLSPLFRLSLATRQHTFN